MSYLKQQYVIFATVVHFPVINKLPPMASTGSCTFKKGTKKKIALREYSTVLEKNDM